MTRSLWTPAYVGLGSNLEQPSVQVSSALSELARIPDTRLVARSRLYRSAPLGPPDQPDYVNAVAGLLTQLAPESLLAGLQRIEAAHGRDRSGPRWGPRTLDLDLLIYAQCELDSDQLTLPHPRMHQRAFVLVPLAEIAPELVVPRHGRVHTLVAGCDRTDLSVMESAP